MCSRAHVLTCSCLCAAESTRHVTVDILSPASRPVLPVDIIMVGRECCLALVHSHHAHSSCHATESATAAALKLESQNPQIAERADNNYYEHPLEIKRAARADGRAQESTLFPSKVGPRVPARPNHLRPVMIVPRARAPDYHLILCARNSGRGKRFSCKPRGPDEQEMERKQNTSPLVRGEPSREAICTRPQNTCFFQVIAPARAGGRGGL